MTENSIKKLAKDILEKRIMDNDKINEYVKDSNLIKTKSDKIVFLKECVKKLPHLGFYVADEFLKCASLTKEYSQFVIWLIRKNSYILGVSSFTEIYDKNSKLFEFLCVELSKNKDILVAHKLGTMLGGLGRKEPEKLQDLVLSNTYPNHPEIVLINSIWQTSYYHKISKKIISKILEYTESNDETVKFHAMFILTNRFTEHSPVQKKLLQFARSDDKTRRVILQGSLSIQRENKSFCLKLIQQCIKTKDEQLKTDIVSNLGFISVEYPTECLIMMKDSIKKSDSPVLEQMVSWTFEQIGKSKDVKKIEKTLLDWIDAEKSRTLLQFTLPRIFTEIYQNNSSVMIDLFKKLNYKQRNKSILITKTLEVFLSNVGSPTKNPTFLDDSKKILLKIAEHQKIDTGIDDQLNDPCMQVLALIENIDLHKKKTKPSVAKKNLKNYQNIIAFFGEAKLHSLIDNRPNHPLVIYLNKAKVSKTTSNKYTKAIDKFTDPLTKYPIIDALMAQYHPGSLLTDLDVSLKMIGNVKSKEIRKMLLDSHQFNSALIQANLFSRLKQKYTVELEPAAGNNKLDLLLTMDKRNYYFEIYTPEENKKSRYIRNVQMIDTEHTKSKISKKLEGQIRAADALNEPLIVVVDNQNMAVDEYDIENALFGTFQITMQIEKKPGEEVKSYTTRADDSFGRKLEYGKTISAIMIVRREVDHQDLKVKLFGRTIPNPYAKIPLDKKTIQKLESVLFDTAIT